MVRTKCSFLNWNFTGTFWRWLVEHGVYEDVTGGMVSEICHRMMGRKSICLWILEWKYFSILRFSIHPQSQELCVLESLFTMWHFTHVSIPKLKLEAVSGMASDWMSPYFEFWTHGKIYIFSCKHTWEWRKTKGTSSVLLKVSWAESLMHNLVLLASAP